MDRKEIIFKNFMNDPILLKHLSKEELDAIIFSTSTNVKLIDIIRIAINNISDDDEKIKRLINKSFTGN